MEPIEVVALLVAVLVLAPIAALAVLTIAWSGERAGRDGEREAPQIVLGASAVERDRPDA